MDTIVFNKKTEYAGNPKGYSIPHYFGNEVEWCRKAEKNRIVCYKLKYAK